MSDRPSDPATASPPPPPASGAPARRISRLGLYLPFAALLLIVAGWSGFWFVVRGQVASGIDRFVTGEAARGATWTCRDQSIGGYPFRIELRCAGLTIVQITPQGAITTEAGPMVAVAQTHRPGHVIVQAAGPVAVALPDGSRLEARWEGFEASHRLTTRGRIERASLQVRRPAVVVSGADGTHVTVTAAAFESHLRPKADGAGESEPMELFVRARELVSGHLDALFADTNPALIEAEVSSGRLGGFAAGINPTTLEAWRLSGEALEIVRLSLTKGLKRAEASGRLGLDAERRLEGRIEPSVANIDQIAGFRLGGGALDLAAALSGRQTSADGLKPLPAIQLTQGRVMLGPIRLPGVELRPLY